MSIVYCSRNFKGCLSPLCSTFIRNSNLPKNLKDAAGKHNPLNRWYLPSPVILSYVSVYQKQISCLKSRNINFAIFYPIEYIFFNKQNGFYMLPLIKTGECKIDFYNLM